MSIEEGKRALAQGDWPAARAAFEAALKEGESPEALEGLGNAASWLCDPTTAFTARERAQALYSQSGNLRSAARVAVFLGVDFANVRGDMAMAAGWLQRAVGLLESVAICPEHCWTRFYQGPLALMEGDLPRAQDHIEALKLHAQRLGTIDLQLLSRAIDGLIQVRRGEVAAGLRQMDEATAAALTGDIGNLNAVADTCCALMYACDSVRDYRRAMQWSRRVEDFCRRWHIRPLFAICRIYYGGAQLWRGAWKEAEEELRAAANELLAVESDWAGEALARLADLRRRQGRVEEAHALLKQAEGHPMCLLVQAALAYDTGDLRGTLDLWERFLRRITEEDRAERVVALELLIRAHLGLGEMQTTRELLSALQAAAEPVDTAPIRGFVALAEGQVAARSGNHEAARRRFDAVDLFQESGAQLETARARVELGRALHAAGRTDAARRELSSAVDALSALEAAGEHARAEAALRDLDAGDASVLMPAGLTAREAEVLRLLAKGRSNKAIAEELFLSVRTVERHVTNIYGKIRAHGKAEATAFALRHGLAT